MKPQPTPQQVAVKLVTAMLEIERDLDRKPNKTEAEKRHLQKLREMRR